MDTLHMFMNIDVAKVEAERFPALAVVLRESFAHKDHKAMLAVHELERAKFLRRGLATPTERDADAALGPERLRIAHAEAEGWRTRQLATPRPPAPPRFTDEQLRIAAAAHTKRGSRSS